MKDSGPAGERRSGAEVARDVAVHGGRCEFAQYRFIARLFH